jgi:hypothetical protein
METAPDGVPLPSPRRAAPHPSPPPPPLPRSASSPSALPRNGTAQHGVNGYHAAEPPTADSSVLRNGTGASATEKPSRRASAADVPPPSVGRTPSGLPTADPTAALTAAAQQRAIREREIARQASAKARDDASRRLRIAAEEQQIAREAWNWRFTRKWITERSRAGIDVDDEGRAFKAILAGEVADVPDLVPRASSSSHLSRNGTLSESLMFPAEQPNARGRSSRVSMMSNTDR